MHRPEEQYGGDDPDLHEQDPLKARDARGHLFLLLFWIARWMTRSGNLPFVSM